MSYYDCPERPLDPPEDEICGYCDFCGGEIYVGEEVYGINGDIIHEDCLLDYAKKNIAVRMEVVR